MRINIKTTNIQITDSIQNYVEQKMRSVEKFAISHDQEEPILEVEVGKTSNRHQSGDIFRAEANMRVRGNHFRATSEKIDLFAAIDDLRDELVRELSSHKEKSQTLFRKGAGMVKNMLRFGREK